MKASSLKDIQTELENLDSAEVQALCLRLARFKKENKELLTYLLFESFDEAAFVRNILAEVDEQFAEMNTSQLYFMKKTIRKILRMLTKYARYAGSPEVEVQLLLHFSNKLKETGIDLQPGNVMGNLYHNQLKKIKKILAGFHEDLRYDYMKELERLLM